MADWNGFKKNGTTYIPNDATARAGVIANTKLIKDTVGWSGKNKFNYNAWKSVTITNGTGVFENNGITLTATSADAYTAHSLSGGYPANAKINVKAGEKISIVWDINDNDPAGHVYMFKYQGTTQKGNVNVSASTKRIDYIVEENIDALTIRFGVTNSGNTIHYKNIMAIDSDCLDLSYEPYFGSTAFPRSEQAVLGAKNVMPYPYRNTTKTDKGITFTDLGTGVIEVNGDNDDTNASSFTLASENTEGLRDFLLKIGSFKISGGISNDVWIDFYNYDGAGSYVSDKGSGANITFTNRTAGFNIMLYVRKGAGVDHLNVKPMLTLLGDNDSTYQYPALTNQQITYKLHHLVHRVVYASTDEGRSDLTIAADGFADISIPSITGYRILTINVTISGAGSSAYSYVSGAGGTLVRRIVNRGSQSYTWGYEVEVYYIATDEID